jgi:hypothetical protein
MMKLIEESSGLGDLSQKGTPLRQVRYQISRYQGFMDGSGMPIPGLYRIEGSIDFDRDKDPTSWIQAPLTLRMEDGRSLQITLADDTGRVLSEGHGPLKCMCC